METNQLAIYTSEVEDLNSGLTQTNPATDQGRT